MPEHGPLYDCDEPDSSRYKVFLDGNWMPKAFRCNTEEGWIERFVIGPDGRFVLEDVTPEAGRHTARASSVSASTARSLWRRDNARLFRVR